MFDRLRYPALAIFVAVTIIYSAFLTRTYYWDGVLFSLYIEKVWSGAYSATVLFHPNHLLYSGVGFLLYSASQLCRFPLRAITVLQLFNVACSAATAALFYKTAKNLFGSKTVIALTTALFAFGATWWKFSTDAGGYVPAVFLSLVAVAPLLKKPGNLTLTSLCHIGAMLIHQLSIFIYLPVLASILLATKNRRNSSKFALLYIAATAIPTGLIYYASFRYTQPGGSSFMRWVLSFSSETQTASSASQALVTYPLSYLKLFAGGKLSLIHDSFSPIVALCLLLCIVSIAVAIQLPKQRDSTGQRLNYGNPKTILWAWLIPYAVFLLWFEPGNAFYKLFLWPPFVLLLGIAITESARFYSRRKSILALAAALVCWNFGAFIFPHSRPNADPVLAFAETIDRELPVNAIVYFRTFTPDDWYLEYFAPHRDWRLLQADPLPTQKSARVDCFETSAWRYLGNKHPPADSKLNWVLHDGRHDIQLTCR